VSPGPAGQGRPEVPIETIGSWRELDDAVAGLGGGGAHAPWVFRGLARSSYSNVASLARLGDGFPALSSDT